MKTIISITIIFCYLYAGIFQDSIKTLPESTNTWNEFWDNLESSKSNFGISAEKTIAYGKEALKIARNWDDTVNVSIAKLCIAAGLESSGDYHSSLNYYLDALDVFIEKKRSYDEAYVYDKIGLLYLNFNDSEQAKQYFNKAKLIYEKLNKKRKIALIYNHIGLAEENSGNLEEAILAFESAINICNKISYHDLLSSLYHNIGKIYLNKKKYKSAEKYYQLSLELMPEIKSNSTLAINYLNFAYLYIDSGQLHKVEKFLVDAEKLIIESGSNNLLKDVYYDYYLYYEKSNNLGKSLEYLKKYNAVKNTITSSQQRGEFEKLLSDYIVNNKNREIKKLETEKDSFWKALNKYKLLGVILLLLVAGSLSIICFLRLKLKDTKSEFLLFRFNEKVVGKISKKYIASKLNDTKKEEIISKIEYLINVEKFYTQNGLTINDFAKKIGVSRTYVSQVVNETYNMTFSNFINSNRVEEAARMMDSGKYQNYTIESIAEEVGFNSTNIFTKAFKQIKGKYPSDYFKT